MKHAFPCCNWTQGLRITTLCVAIAVSFDVLANELKFEQIFSVKGEPVTLHYQAEFTVKNGKHQMDVWRDGDQRVKRRTDDEIETYAFRKSGDPEFYMSILDMKKHIHTRIDRTNLYRVGNFTDWFGLAHGLKHPMGAYQIVKSLAPDDSPKAIEACQWYDLNQNSQTTRICWSTQNRIPLLIQTQHGGVVWRVTSLDRKAISAEIFEINDQGFIQNDANQDIERD